MKRMPKIRIPVAPPGKVMKSVKDYDRKMQSVVIDCELNGYREREDDYLYLHCRDINYNHQQA